jgi:squalene synthase HpnC
VNAPDVFCPASLVLPQSLRQTLPAAGAGARAGGYDYASAHAYCRALARSHYENFHVGTWLLPAPVREHAYNVYAYCRWSDDLADETHDPAMSLRLLAWWRERLEAAYAGRADHPVFVALARTIAVCDIPKKPFVDLIEAFELDQRKNRYADFGELAAYCEKSANPVGRLVLYLLGYRDEQRFALSDKTCTALQLANHWQDVARDLAQDRIYLPQDSMARFGVAESDLRAPAASKNVRELIAFEVARARAMFHEGLPLVALVRGRARLDIELFSRGGLAILDAIEAQGCDVLARRPVIGGGAKLRLLGGVLLGAAFGRRRAEASA